MSKLTELRDNNKAALKELVTDPKELAYLRNFAEGMSNAMVSMYTEMCAERTIFHFDTKTGKLE
jgi:hypothetical protein